MIITALFLGHFDSFYRVIKLNLPSIDGVKAVDKLLDLICASSVYVATIDTALIFKEDQWM